MGYSWVGEEREDFPYRTAVRICTEQAAGGFVIGSGVMISPIHVLTAGHVAAPRPGLPAGIEVWPAIWDGFDNQDGSREAEPFEETPFGTSQGIRVNVPSAWLNYGDSRYDIAVVTVDRPIGAMTGWVGRLFDGGDYLSAPNCRRNDFFAATQFTMNTFPGGLNQMRSWTGTFDYLGPWHGPYAGFFAYFLHTTPTEHAIAGESGGGVLSYVGQAPLVSSVIIAVTTAPLLDGGCYESDETHNVALRIDQEKFNFINNNTILPRRFDIVPMDVRVGCAVLPKMGPPSHCFPTGEPVFLEVNAGSPLPPISVLLVNRSTGSWAGEVPYELYVSSDSVIDPDDPSDVLVDSGSL
jgi:hypothetical protein